MYAYREEGRAGIERLWGNLLQPVIPTEARHLALHVFTAVRDSSSPVAPRNDRLIAFSH